MNPFLLVISALYLAAAGWELWRRGFSMAVLYIAFSVSNIILAGKR